MGWDGPYTLVGSAPCSRAPGPGALIYTRSSRAPPRSASEG